MSNTTAAAPPPPLPTDPIPLTNGLTLTPRIKFNLTIFPSSPSPPPLYEWNLKHSLLTFLKSSPSLPSTIPFPDDDLVIRRYRDTKKRKREDPVARGWQVGRELGFVGKGGVGGLGEWRRVIVDTMDGMDVNLEGVRFRVRIEVLAGEEFEGMRKECEEDLVLRNENSRGYAGSGKRELDTLTPREGSRLKADYELTWDKDGFFQSSRSNAQESKGRYPAAGAVRYGSNPASWQMRVPRWSPDNTRQKRYRHGWVAHDFNGRWLHIWKCNVTDGRGSGCILTGGFGWIQKVT
ncbi:hypothetical protein AKJ16_DCAP13539 [Drosera capensis]